MGYFTYRRVIEHDLFDTPIMVSVWDDAGGLDETAMIAEFERLFAPAMVISVKPWRIADRCLVYDQIIKIHSHEHN